MEVSGVTGTGSEIEFVDADQVGFSGLNAEAFMKLLIATLQNQDPTEPVGNEELLSQVSMMRNLQSNIELGEAVKAISTNQQLSTAATFIGTQITGAISNDQSVTGIVERAFLRGGKAFVGLADGGELLLSNITSVDLPG